MGPLRWPTRLGPSPATQRPRADTLLVSVWTGRDEIRTRLLAALTAEQAQRSGRTLDDWLRAERHIMFQITNAERINLGKTPVSLLHIEKAERKALGHSDYSEKWALYCTQIVLDEFKL